MTDKTRYWYELEPVYARDDHLDLVITETYYVVAETLDDAKQYILDDTGRESISEWRTAEENEADIPDRVPDGPILLSKDEQEAVKEEIKAEPLSEECKEAGYGSEYAGTHVCYICGVYPAPDPDDPVYDETDFGCCYQCGLPDLFGPDLLAKRERGHFHDGTATNKKTLKWNPDDVDRPETQKQEEANA